MLAVDGTEPQELRRIMELELDNKEEQEEKIPQLFESVGGFSPTHRHQSPPTAVYNINSIQRALSIGIAVYGLISWNPSFRYSAIASFIADSTVSRRIRS